MMGDRLHAAGGSVVKAVVAAAAAMVLGVLFVMAAGPGSAQVFEGGEAAAATPEAEPRSGQITVDVVFDNNPGVEGLETAWGFACVIEGLDERILFDTGNGGRLLLASMAALGLGPEDIDAVVLSHAHRDHTGGLETVLEERGAAREADAAVQVVMPESLPSGLKEEVRELGADLVETDGPHQVCPGAWTTGVLGDGEEEQGLYLVTSKGLVVITGCAHPGIVNLAMVAQRHANAPVRAVLGGFHMVRASTDEISEVIDELQELGVERVAPCHGSGDETRRLMKEAFGAGYRGATVGTRLVFD